MLAVAGSPPGMGTLPSIPARVTPLCHPHAMATHLMGPQSWSQGGAGMRVQWIYQLFLGLAGRIILINTPIIAAAPQERDEMPALQRKVLLNL